MSVRPWRQATLPVLAALLVLGACEPYTAVANRGRDAAASLGAATVGCDGVVVLPGGSLQAAVDRNSAGTTFCLMAGTYAGQEVRPKSGNSFVGVSGTVLDGQGAAIAFRPTADNVTIQNLTIEGYKPGAQVGAIQAGGHTIAAARSGWVVEGNTVQGNDGVGIRIGSDMVVRNNKVLRNGQLGIGGVGDRTLVEGNEIAHNNPDNLYDPGWEAGGTKFVKTTNLVVRGNFVHHNVGPGLWTDIDNRATLYENNRVEDNTEVGIFHEISYSVTIRGNEVRRNGFGMQRWAYGAGILIAHSADATVHNNLLEGNWNGLLGIQQNRGSGQYGAYQLRNLHAYDNTIIMGSAARDGSGNGSWAAGLATDYGESRIYGEWNNRFTSNDYQVPNPDTSWWTIANKRQVWTAWRASGQDSVGTLNAAPTSSTPTAKAPTTSAPSTSTTTTTTAPAPTTTAPAPTTSVPAVIPKPAAILLAGSTSLNQSEVLLRTHLQGLGYTVSVVRDVDVTTSSANAADLVVMSKTVLSTNVGTKLKPTTTPVVFWEDNQQQLSMLATIDSSNTTGTGWHKVGREILVNGSVAPAMRAGLSGSVSLLQSDAHLTYAPRSNKGVPTVAASAVKIAQFGSAGDGRWVVYTIPAGAVLADGTKAAGRRSYFGLYDDTFRLTSPDGLALFDALTRLR